MIRIRKKDDSLGGVAMKDGVRRKRCLPLHINYLVLFAFCFLLYMPDFKIPLVFTILLSCGLPAIYILMNIRLLSHLGLKQITTLFCILLLVLISYVVPLIHGTDDFSYTRILLTSCRMLLSYVALLCLVIKTHGKEKLIYYFMYYYILTHIVYVIVTILMVVFPILRELWFSIVEKDQQIRLSGSYIFRIGWQGFSGFRLTLHCTLSVIFALFLRYGSKIPMLSTRQFLIFIIGCFVGNMFYGRSGLIVSIIVCLAAFLYWNRKKPVYIITSMMIVGGILGGISLLKYIPSLSNWYEWMSSPVVSLVTTGEMNDGSFDTLQKMQRVEISEETFMYGDGYYGSGNGHYYMSTDAGFIRNILFWGIFGAIFSYGLTLYSIVQLQDINKLMMLQLLFTFLAFEYKGAVYYEFIAIGFALLLGFYLSDSRKLQNQQKYINEGTISVKN